MTLFKNCSQNCYLCSHGSGCEDLFALQGDKKNFLFLLHEKAGQILK